MLCMGFKQLYFSHRYSAILMEVPFNQEKLSALPTTYNPFSMIQLVVLVPEWNSRPDIFLIETVKIVRSKVISVGLTCCCRSLFLRPNSARCDATSKNQDQLWKQCDMTTRGALFHTVGPENNNMTASSCTGPLPTLREDPAPGPLPKARAVRDRGQSDLDGLMNVGMPCRKSAITVMGEGLWAGLGGPSFAWRPEQCNYFSLPKIDADSITWLLAVTQLKNVHMWEGKLTQ